MQRTERGGASMQALIDFLPVIVFFVAYQVADIYVATVAIIAAMGLQIAWQWARTRTVSRMLLTSGGLVAVFGGITLLVREPLFIQWKPTVVNWLFAAAFLGSRYIGGKTLTERIMGHAVELDAAMWRQLNLMWVGNFTVLGAANLYVVYRFSEAVWVNFKLFGMLGVTLLTVIAQVAWIAARTSDNRRRAS